MKVWNIVKKTLPFFGTLGMSEVALLFTASIDI